MSKSSKSRELTGKPGLAEIFSALSGIVGLGVAGWKQETGASSPFAAAALCKQLGREAVFLSLNSKEQLMRHIARGAENPADAIKGIISPSRKKAGYKSIETVEILQERLAKKALSFLKRSLDVVEEYPDARVASPCVIAKKGKFIASVVFGGTAQDISEHIHQMLEREKTSSLVRPLIEFTFSNKVVDPFIAPYLPVAEEKKKQGRKSQYNLDKRLLAGSAAQPALM